MIAYSTLALIVLLPATTFAQEAARPKESLKVPTAVFAVAAAADWASTYRLLQRPEAREVNPMFGWLDNKPGPMVALGAATDAVGVAAWNKFVGKRWPKVAKVGLYAASAFRAYLAVRNHRLLKDSIREAAGARR